MEIKILNLGMNGEGVGKLENKTCFVPFCLPDEIVDIDIGKDCGNYYLAKLNKVVSESTNRVTPPCKYFFKCGGCQLQHLNYAEQLKFKQELVKSTLKKILNKDYQVNETIPCPTTYNYRNKASFNFVNNQSGFYEEGSNKIVEVDKCLLLNTQINDIYSLFINYIKGKTISKYVKHLVVRSIDNQTLVGIVVNKDIDVLPFLTILQQKFKDVGLYKIINSRKDSVVLSGKCVYVGGIKEIKINNFNISYSVDLLGFHQTNIEIQNKIYTYVLNNINQNDTVLNGFSGAGLLSAVLANKAKQVYGIEIVKQSHQSAEELKRLNDIHNLTNICGDFYKTFKDIKAKISCVVLDPSKKGCGKLAMQAIKGVNKIIYISCNPIALAKDLRELLDCYKLDSITPADMFPNTKNVETIVVLQLKK